MNEFQFTGSYGGPHLQAPEADHLLRRRTNKLDFAPVDWSPFNAGTFGRDAVAGARVPSVYVHFLHQTQQSQD